MAEDCWSDGVVNAGQALDKKRRTLTKRRGRKRQDEKCFVEEPDGTDERSGVIEEQHEIVVTTLREKASKVFAGRVALAQPILCFPPRDFPIEGVLTKHGDPTCNVIDCSIKGTSGNDGHLGVIVGPLEKQYPERWPRKMFNQQRFIPYPPFTGKDPRARNAEMATWINKLRVKWEPKDMMGRPLTSMQIIC
ncbi:hypothetical protein I307_02830 [Cryptococcus deuterogattii 99/473]|uniref:Uncharacterized protein n=1 Tax=Cryptococcus deuterogattii Ram5 TaxID=1296110 RepID=A0A0D0UU41_9TREE|nr:hypothetical protein I309_03230 [Cryptococcus deuterogattii LA55]KIR38746.1 hypothetical protein I313_05384 [Cryptococcus deuterogattii Ram5]KIR90541.1 hypothetical protein I304_05683 [Cryptococcus deuterogattii CBS 10090]KIR97273.1 hypothetical protein L804_05455 [Cryptococcus deuterogattii 2001/935-1]KIY57757.1 hypothetical protein I307_02830 [Cryptococcus deuterogattii 99/473]